MKKRLAALSIVFASVFGVLFGLDVTPAGALNYVNEMPLNNGDVLRCYEGLVNGGAQRNFQCNRHASGSGAYIQNEMNIWVEPNYCDSIAMLWQPSGSDLVFIYNGSNQASEDTDSYSGAPGCASATVGSGTEGMGRELVWFDGGTRHHGTYYYNGAQFLTSNVGSFTSCLNGWYSGYSCNVGSDWAYVAYWS